MDGTAKAKTPPRRRPKQHEFLVTEIPFEARQNNRIDLLQHQLDLFGTSGYELKAIYQNYLVLSRPKV